LGYRLDLSPQTTLLASLIHSNTDFQRESKQVNSTPFGPVTTAIKRNEEVDAVTGELQLLSTGDIQRWVVGLAYYDEDTEGESSTAYSASPSFPFPLPEAQQSGANSESDHSNGYLYSYRTINDLELILGLSYDSFSFESDDGDINRDRFNPKFGLIWRPYESLTWRAAGFKTMKRSLIGKRTLEPTHVAGFNQFYDDVTGTEARFIGVGADYRFSSGQALGAEVSGRSLDVPFIGGDSEDQEERALSAYYYQTFGTRWSAGIAAKMDRFKRDPPLPEARKPNKLRTFRLPIDLGYHDPNGLYASLSVINVRQELEGVAANGKDSERFVTVNGRIGYRFPKRRGGFGIEVNNLFDQDFRYFGEDFQTGTLRRLEFLPERTISAQAWLNF
jgi:hypothetical protein